MSSMLLSFIGFTVAGAWLFGLAVLVLTCENRRFWRLHQQRPSPSTGTFPRTHVVIPCKGMEHRLRENLTAFIQQDHPNFEICFVVESRDDSAYQLINNVMRENRHVKSKIVIAGRAGGTGQKVHNLLFATKDLAPEIQVLVFADSDANPGSSWLKWLVHEIGEDRVGGGTGYPWMVPGNNCLATLLGCTINNMITSLMGRGSRFPAWGGSWAIQRKVFDSVGIRQSWKGVLDDGLVASRSLWLSRLKINFEPRCVCTSKIKFTMAELVAYVRRHLILLRIYQPVYFVFALCITLVGQIGFWGGLMLGISWLVQGNLNGWWLLASTAGLYALGVGCAFVRQNMGRLVSHQWRTYRRARKFDIAAGPLTGLVTLLLLIVSGIGSRLTWRGIHYNVSRMGRVQLIGREIEPAVLLTLSGNDRKSTAGSCAPIVSRSMTRSRSDEFWSPTHSE